MKKLRHIVSIFLVLSMCASMCLPAFAYTSELSRETENSTMAKMIERDRQMMYDDLAAQLEAQDALDKIDRFLYLIDASIQAKYYSDAPMVTRSTTYQYSAPNGGWYKTTGTYADIETQFLNVDQTAVAKAERYNGKQSLIAGLLGVGLNASNLIGGIGAILTISSLCNCLLDWLQWGDIQAGQDCVYITSSYDKLDLKTITLVWKWVKYPNMTVIVADGDRLVGWGAY